MQTVAFDPGDLSDSWIEGLEGVRWRTTSGHRGSASGSSLLEVAPGNRLGRHTDSAEETIVVISGRARITVGDQTSEVDAGGVALVPECVAHEVEAIGDRPLRFAAVYASADVITTYEHAVQPDGERSRRPFG